ncbi:MAG: hypothetical protein QNJ11_18535 [Woeseiaceae bacterium]|nr:hypothetical protein [Woeseiaceae bacterium]
MVANRATADVSPGRMAREMAQHMEDLAAKGQWSSVEHIVIRLRSVVLEVPESERREVMRFVNACLERVRTEALSSRGDVTGKLSEIRRGRDAARAYGGSLKQRPPTETELR